MKITTHNPTTTPGKIAAVSKQRRWILDNGLLANKKPTDYMATLVGHPEGLERHIDEAVKLGFSPRRLIVIEHSELTHKWLLEENKELGSPIPDSQIIYGDLVYHLHAISQTKKRVVCIDADFAHAFTVDMASQAKKLAALPHTSVLILTHCLRNRTDFWLKVDGVSDNERNKVMKAANILLQRDIKPIKRHSYNYCGAGGRTPMGIHILGC